MTLVLATESNPGSSNWVDVSTIGGGWVLFTDPGDGGTLNVGSSSGECPAIVTSPGETTIVNPPTALGQMLVLSCTSSPPPSGPAPMVTNSRSFLFSDPVDNLGHDLCNVLESLNYPQGGSALFVALYVSLSNNNPVLMWRSVSTDGPTLDYQP